MEFRFNYAWLLLGNTVVEHGGNLGCMQTNLPVVNDRNPTISTARFSPIIALKLRSHPIKPQSVNFTSTIPHNRQTANSTNNFVDLIMYVSLRATAARLKPEGRFCQEIAEQRLNSGFC